MANVTVDTTAMSTPAPVLKTKQTMDRLPAGSMVELLGTDPGSEIDLESYCEFAGHRMLYHSVKSGRLSFLDPKTSLRGPPMRAMSEG